MTIGLKFAIVRTVAVTGLIVLGLLVAAVPFPVPVTAQSPSGSRNDPVSFLESAKMQSIMLLRT